MPGLALMIDYTCPPDVAKRKWSDFCKEANRKVAIAWQKHYSGRRYEEYGAARYRLARRAPSTLRRKAKLAEKGRAYYGGRVALVESGLLSEQMQRRGSLRVYPTRLVLTFPTHVPRRPRFSTIDLHDEATRVIPEEADDLSRLWKLSIEGQLATYKPRRRKVI